MRGLHSRAHTIGVNDGWVARIGIGIFSRILSVLGEPIAEAIDLFPCPSSREGQFSRRYSNDLSILEVEFVNHEWKPACSQVNSEHIPRSSSANRLTSKLLPKPPKSGCRSDLS